MRLALMVYYDGRGFHGSQRQPEKRTVEGELLKALESLGIAPGNFQGAARTDRGVSALGNVYAFDAGSLFLPRALNSFLPGDVRVLAAREVGADFHPRYEAREKVYRYFMYDDGCSLRRMRGAARVLEGEHSFHNFARLESGRDPVRRLRRVRVASEGDILVLSFKGESFLWEMVRRMVSALGEAGRGRISRAELQRCLDPEVEKKFPPADAEGLLLWRIRYPFEFTMEEYSRKRLLGGVMRSMMAAKTRAAMEETVYRSLRTR